VKYTPSPRPTLLEPIWTDEERNAGDPSDARFRTGGDATINSCSAGKLQREVEVLKQRIAAAKADRVARLTRGSLHITDNAMMFPGNQYVRPYLFDKQVWTVLMTTPGAHGLGK
jgi:hypothetical protein